MRDAIVKDDFKVSSTVGFKTKHFNASVTGSTKDLMRDAIVKDLMRDAIVKNDNMRDAVVKDDYMRDAIVKDLMRDAIVKNDLDQEDDDVKKVMDASLASFIKVNTNEEHSLEADARR